MIIMGKPWTIATRWHRRRRLIVGKPWPSPRDQHGQTRRGGVLRRHHICYRSIIYTDCEAVGCGRSDLQSDWPQLYVTDTVPWLQPVLAGTLRRPHVVRLWIIYRKIQLRQAASTLGIQGWKLQCKAEKKTQMKIPPFP